jgi:hypothetical protein
MSYSSLSGIVKGDMNGEKDLSEPNGNDDKNAKLPSITKLDSVDDEVTEEVIDEEENLFITLEQEQVKEEENDALRPHPELADASAAPRLLQEALKKGDIKADDPPDAEVALIENGKSLTAVTSNGGANESIEVPSDRTHQNQHRVSRIQ